jgi:hypothetical protein
MADREQGKEQVTAGTGAGAGEAERVGVEAEDGVVVEVEAAGLRERGDDAL